MVRREEARGGAWREPCVRALLLESIGYALIDLFIGKDFFRFPIGEDGNRHAPGALARDDPIGATGDHAGDAVFARGRIPFRDGDLAQRDLAQSGCLPRCALILSNVRSTRLEGWRRGGTLALQDGASRLLMARVRGGLSMGLSSAINHCGVLRKMTGFLERQECGY